MKEGDGPAIRMGMKLIKRRIYFRITTRLGNSKRQHCSRQEKKVYIYVKKGPLFKKTREGKKEEK